MIASYWKFRWKPLNQVNLIVHENRKVSVAFRYTFCPICCSISTLWRWQQRVFSVHAFSFRNPSSLTLFVGTFTVDWICVNFHHNKKNEPRFVMLSDEKQRKGIEQSQNIHFFEGSRWSEFLKNVGDLCRVQFKRIFWKCRFLFFFASHFDTLWLVVRNGMFININLLLFYWHDSYFSFRILNYFGCVCVLCKRFSFYLNDTV